MNPKTAFNSWNIGIVFYKTFGFRLKFASNPRATEHLKAELNLFRFTIGRFLDAIEQNV